MKTQRLALLLTAINLILLIVILFRLRPAADGIVPVLRGHKLEIIDDNGKIRAAIAVTPETTMPDGQKYAESALLRLIDPNGRPGVKIGTSPDGSAMSLAGDSEKRDWNGVQILANAAGCTVKLTNKDGREQTVKP